MCDHFAYAPAGADDAADGEADGEAGGEAAGGEAGPSPGEAPDFWRRAAFLRLLLEVDRLRLPRLETHLAGQAFERLLRLDLDFDFLRLDFDFGLSTP